MDYLRSPEADEHFVTAVMFVLLTGFFLLAWGPCLPWLPQATLWVGALFIVLWLRLWYHQAHVDTRGTKRNQVKALIYRFVRRVAVGLVLYLCMLASAINRSRST